MFTVLIYCVRKNLDYLIFKRKMTKNFEKCLKFFTFQKTVGGTLLVTPNAVMFDPDVLDPLVKEHGIDKYGLIIRYLFLFFLYEYVVSFYFRMDLLAGIALYEDFAMYEHVATAR